MKNAALLALGLATLLGCNASFRSVPNESASNHGGSGDGSPVRPEPEDAEGNPNPNPTDPHHGSEDEGPKGPEQNAGQNPGQSQDPGQGPGQNPGGKDPVQNEPEALELEVLTPSPEIRAGGEQMPATARIVGGDPNPKVTWSVTGPMGRADIGTIDANGVYTSPMDGESDFSVTLIATLVSDPTVKGSKPLRVLPLEQIFARCEKNNMIFPILAHVYQMNASATALPNFANPSEARKVTTVCMDSYAVSPRDFEAGFPDVPGLNEFFALQTTTTLIVPETGSYTLLLNSDDGARLYIDGQQVIDNDGLHQAQGPEAGDSPDSGSKQVTLQLTKGDHPLQLNYFQGPRYRLALELKWKKPGASQFEYVPRASFK